MKNDRQKGRKRGCGKGKTRGLTNVFPHIFVHAHLRAAPPCSTISHSSYSQCNRCGGVLQLSDRRRPQNFVLISLAGRRGGCDLGCLRVPVLRFVCAADKFLLVHIVYITLDKHRDVIFSWESCVEGHFCRYLYFFFLLVIYLHY